MTLSTAGPGPLPALARPASLALAIALANLAGASLTATQWTAGSTDLAAIAMLSASLFGLLALLRVPGSIPLVAFALVVGLAIGHFGTADLTTRPGDAASLVLLGSWGRRLAADAAFGSGGLNSALFSLLAAAVGAVAGWEAIRFRGPLLTLAPVAVAYSVGLLNAVGDRFLPTLEFLALVLVLWLVHAFGAARSAAARDGMRVTGAARGRLLSTGAAIAATTLVAAVAIPPLSTRDASGVFDSGLTRLRSTLGGTAPGTNVGFSFDVALGGQLVAGSQPVLTYAYDGPSPVAAPLYLRGVNLERTADGQWREQGGLNTRTLPPGANVSYAETYREQALITTHIRVVSAPPGAAGVVFHPGSIVSADAPLALTGQPLGRGPRGSGLTAIDEVLFVAGTASSYTVQSLLSTASEEQLSAAGTGYPGWVMPYATLTGPGNPFYRPAADLARTAALAQRITKEATSPYEKAKAIESYLRGNFSYTLTPPPTPRGRDPLDFFLFTSRAGYCQFYATAMGDLLRSLGIPTRLVNGFGSGGSAGPGGEYTVTSGDAHTWVEVYFPSYGWIPFEPTPQLGYSSIMRGPGLPAKAPDSAAPDASPTATPAAAASVTPEFASAGGRRTSPSTGPMRWQILVLPALLLLAGLGFLLAWWPRDIAGAWRRTLLLSRIAGVPERESDTPQEFGQRLARVHPEIAPVIGPLVSAYAEAAYSPKVSPQLREAILAGWRQVGPDLLRLALRRLGQRPPRAKRVPR